MFFLFTIFLLTRAAKQYLVVQENKPYSIVYPIDQTVTFSGKQCKFKMLQRNIMQVCCLDTTKGEYTCDEKDNGPQMFLIFKNIFFDMKRLRLLFSGFL